VSAEIVLLFIVGAAMLLGGAEALVRGASRLAVASGISPLVVGLTVVAFGTSAPELAVTVGAAAAGGSGVAIGNVVGSNIFNILLILGVSALIAPLVVAQQLVRLDVPLLIGVSIVVLAMSLDGRIGSLEGAALFAGVVAYTVFLIRKSRAESRGVREEYEGAFGGERARGSRWPVNLALVAGGLVLLVVGAQWLVDASVTIASSLGVSDLVIGLTIVAAGTSLPEVATSVIASLRGERDIAVGNVVGSCLFNLMVVLGLGSIVAPGGVPIPPGAVTFDIPIMIGVSIAALPIFVTGFTIARWEGLLFLGYYVAYAVFIVLQATEHAVLDQFMTAMVWFVLPLTAVTLAVTFLRSAWRQGVAPPEA
jgi:cation:H+ antiporter